MISRRNAAKTLVACLGLLAVGCGTENTNNLAAKGRDGAKPEANSTPAVVEIPRLATRGSRGGAPKAEEKPVNVLCSFFPVYLFTKNVVGDAPGVTVALMLPASKGCPHGYDLTPGDGKRIAEADVVVLNGGGLEEFDEKKIRRFSPTAKIIDSVKGMTLADAECCHDEEEEGAEHHHHESGKNPHTFTSPLMAAQQVKTIGDELAKADSSRAETYKKNAAAYAAKLEALGKEMKDALPKAKGAKVVTSHEIFQYLAADLGVKVVGEVQSGGKGDAPPKKLIETIKKEKAAAIFTEPQYSTKKAEMIAKEAGVKTYQLDPIASGPDDAGADYYEKTMRANIDVLKKALGGA
jgi:zinc transport system substrate-binding protein